MNEIDLLAVAAWIIVSLFGALTGLLVWLGNKVIARLDAVVEKLESVAGQLHHRINGIDRRVTVIETRCGEQLRERRS